MLIALCLALEKNTASLSAGEVACMPHSVATVAGRMKPGACRCMGKDLQDILEES